ncbi:MAG TPA: ABC transporter substrate-binding protein [Acidimicrobiales bacterium]|nr:ABC transporter substrate-binding protein [Acidimicrobiales bacterium]
MFGKRAGAVVAAAALLLGSACGDDKTSPTADAPRATTGPEIPVGFVNAEGGTLSFPDTRITTEVGVAHFNKNGGVKGRPLKLVRCDVDGSPEKAIDCANKFVEAKVVAVLEGIGIGTDAMLPILKSASIPLVGHVPFGPQQQTSADAVFLGSALPAIAAVPLKFFSEKGAKKLVYLSIDGPNSRQYFTNNLEPVAKKLGITVKPVYFSPSSPDFTVLVNTAMAEKPDVIGTAGLSEAMCTSMINAVRGTSFKGDVFAGSCFDFAKTVGAKADGVYAYADTWWASAPDDAPPAKAKEIREYLDAMKASGNEAKAITTGQVLFAAVMDLGRILATIEGDITGPKILAALRATKGFPAFMGGTLTCDGSAWKGQSSCAASALVYQAKGGVMRPVSKDFVDVSSFAPAA